jgi:hypothetical protein
VSCAQTSVAALEEFDFAKVLARGHLFEEEVALGIIHAVTLLAIILIAAPLARYIPLATLRRSLSSWRDKIIRRARWTGPVSLVSRRTANACPPLEKLGRSAGG